MLVFISWSGKKSKIIAEFLEGWLRQVIQAIDPWISSDITKGSRWNPEITAKLEASKVGIICLTKDNLNSEWILFEAGAISKTKDAYVCTLLLGLNSSDVEYPLAQFQHTSTQKEDFKHLLITINKALLKCNEKSLSENTLEDTFETYWPRLEQKFIEINSIKDERDSPVRTGQDMLQEILETVRNQEKKINLINLKLSIIDRDNQLVDNLLLRHNKNQIINDCDKKSLRYLVHNMLYSDTDNLYDKLNFNNFELPEENTSDKK